MSDSREGFFPHKTPDTEKEERDSEEGRLGDPRQAVQFMRVRQENEQASREVLFASFFDVFN